MSSDFFSAFRLFGCSGAHHRWVLLAVVILVLTMLATPVAVVARCGSSSRVAKAASAVLLAV